MSYAKPCKFCNKISIVWRKEGDKNIPVEAMTMQDHTREKCDAAKNGGSPAQVQDQRTFKTTSPQQTQIREATPNEAMLARLDNLNIAIAKVMSQNTQQDEKLDNLLFLAKNLNEQNSPTERDNMILRQKVTELEAAFEKVEKKSFVPANQVVSAIEEGQNKADYDQHVRDMVKKGEEEEEMET